MIEEYTYDGEDFCAVFSSKDWKIGLIRFSERFSRLGQLERHLETDEIFVLLSGNATLYTDTEKTEMKPCCVYNIPAGVWHHIVVSEDALILVAENENTSKLNTEKRTHNAEGEAVC